MTQQLQQKKSSRTILDFSGLDGDDELEFDPDEGTPKRSEFTSQEKCGQRLDCSHNCSGRYVDCSKSPFHEPCSDPCSNMLICGHLCESPCKMCGPCFKMCERRCVHGPCKNECFRPCVKCREPCTHECPHIKYKCKNMCYEGCNRICQERCPKLLPCGHKCCGFCDENCPPVCQICDKDDLLELEELLLGETEISEDDRFICLPNCGHTFSAKFMDGYMNTKTQEIIPKRCPICKTIIYHCRRYSAIVNAYFEDIENVKRKIYGDYEEIIDFNHSTLSKLNIGQHENSYFQKFRNFVYLRLCIPSKSIAFQQVDLVTAKCLDYLAWVYTELIELVRELESKQVSLVYVQNFASFDVHFGQFIRTVPLPLSKQAYLEIECELKRLRDLRVLLLYRSESQEPGTLRRILAKSDRFQFSEAIKILSNLTRYTEENQTTVHDYFNSISQILNCTLKISETDRKMIVQAFGRRTGRFFRCSEGHVYVITECGGAMEEGTCPECNKVIGGVQHRVRQGNFLATEMDGANKPLWPAGVLRN